MVFDNYNASSYFQDFISQPTYFDTGSSIFDTHGVYTSDINPFDTVAANELKVLADDFGVDISDDYYDLGLGSGDMARELDGDPFINAIFEDASTISQTELNLLDDTGVVDYDTSGQLVLDGTDEGINSVNDVIAAIDTKIDQGDLSTGDSAALNQLKTELNHSVDMGVGAVTFDNPDMPIGSERTFDNAGNTQYTDPYYSPYGYTVSPGLNTPLVGNLLLNQKGDPSFVGDYGNGRVGPTMESVYGRSVDNLGQLSYGEAFGTMSPNAIAQAQARREYADAMGTPNMFDRSGLLVENRMGLNDHFDNFTDFLSGGVTTLLSPLDALAGGIGQGIAKVGGMVGDNVVGRGISNFGRVIDGTGDFLFNQVPNTVINYPDNIANIGSGLYRTLTGADMGIGQPTNTGLLMSGVKGLFTDPLKLGLNALSIPLSVATDVFGIDKITIGGGAGGGRGSGKKKKKKKQAARKNVPLVMNKDGSLRREGSNDNKGAGAMAIGQPVNGNLESGDSGSGGGIGTGDGTGTGNGSTVNVNGFDGDDSGAQSGKLQSTDADKSDVKEAVSETQGDPGSTATQPQQSTSQMDLLDQAAGEQAIVLDPEQLQALNSYEDVPESIIRVPIDFQGGNTFRSDRTLTA
jgi:hypothetical protein